MPSEPRVTTLAHPIRLAIVRHLAAHAEASPQDLAAVSNLESVSYHMRVLRDAGVIRLARTEQRRGAIRHVYRLNRRQSARLASELRGLADALDLR